MSQGHAGAADGGHITLDATSFAGRGRIEPREIITIFDTAQTFVEPGARPRKKRTNLVGKVVANLFFEPSTRMRTSFGLAARRLSADVLDFTPSGSSLSKGETFIDTAKNIEAMGIDLIVVRHSSSGAPHLLAQHLQCGIINAGDGAARASHPRLARHFHDSANQKERGRADRGPGRRHRA